MVDNNQNNDVAKEEDADGSSIDVHDLVTLSASNPVVEILEADSANLTLESANTGTQTDEHLSSENFSSEDSSSREPASKDIIRYDPLARYLSEIKQFPSLSREEEHALAVLYKEQGDKQAGYKLVMANLRLVVIVAREYQRQAQNILDLVQEGNIGLLEAIKKYDPYQGIRFPSYAIYWIRAYMLRYLISNLRLVKIGTTQAQRKLFFNLQKEKRKLEEEGFAPEAKLLAERLNVKESEVIEMDQRLGLPDLSVDAPLNSFEGKADMHSILPDRNESVEATVVKSQFSEVLREALEEFKKKLDEKEIAIIDRRLFTEDPVTLQEIAEDFSLSRERIRQIEAKLKSQLKDYLKDKLQIIDDEDASLDV